jgi:hypothetical protein
MLEQLGFQTKGLIEIVKPFESWQGSPIQDWTVTYEMLNMGDLMDISNMIANSTSIEIMYASKVYLLAKALKAINDQSLITSEDVETYNKNHNLTGKDIRNIFDLKVLMIKGLSEIIVNRLAFMYDEIQEKYLSQLLGKPLPDELKPTLYKDGGLDSAGGEFDDTSSTDSTTPATE